MTTTLKKLLFLFILGSSTTVVKLIDLPARLGARNQAYAGQDGSYNLTDSHTVLSDYEIVRGTPHEFSLHHGMTSKDLVSNLFGNNNVSSTYSRDTSSSHQKRDKLLFRIGLIVPKTAFSSQYKTYTQRIKDHLLQLSRQQTVHHERVAQSIGLGGSSSNSGIKSISSLGQTTSESRPPAASCSASTLPPAHSRPQWQNLTFNQYFDIRVVDLVSFAPRSSAQDIIESMCQKLIEQNVSVIVYLENNQNQAVASSLSRQKSFIHSLTSYTNRQSPKSLSSDLTHEQSPVTTLTNDASSSHAPSGILVRHKAAAGQQNLHHSSAGESNGPPKTSSQAHFIMHLAHSAGIPMIAWSVTGAQAQRPKKQKTLHLAPTVAREAEAMLAIMRRYSWFSFSVVSSTLAGHDDFILALRHFMTATNGGSSSMNGASGIGSTGSPLPSNSSTKSSELNNTSPAGDNSYPPSKSFSLEPEVLAQPSKMFKLLDVITIRQPANIEEEVRKLTVSETRVIILYSTREEAIEILKVANKLKLTKRSYAWIVAQSVIGQNENEKAPPEFHPGLLGVYFRSNHERLLDELSRAISIIVDGLEGLIRDENASENLDSRRNKINCEELAGLTSIDAKFLCNREDRASSPRLNRTRGSLGNNAREGDDYIEETQLIMNQHHKMLTSHSTCRGKLSRLSAERRDLLYDYFRKSSPQNEFDADGLLKNVELNVVNLDNERQWRRIGCFSDATLTINDITWPEQAERPPSGTMEKFHLRAVFLEEPSFLNLADPDSETGACKTNRAVRCRYKVAMHPLKSNVQFMKHSSDLSTRYGSSMNRSDHNQYQKIRTDTAQEYEYKCCSGFCIDLMEKFATDLKFSYELYRVPDGYWGILENNTWNGLIGEIVKGNADVVVSSTKINSNRQAVVDFTEPFLDTGISILVAKQTGVISKLAFLEPFDTLAWIMFICVGVPLATASIFFFELLSPSGFYSRGEDEVGGGSFHYNDAVPTTRRHHKFSFCRTLWLVITILFGSAAHIDSPKGYTARFMSNVWATFAVVFLAVYTANLAAFMITREEYLELSGINDSKLAYPYHRHPPLKFGTVAGGNTHTVLSTNRPKLYDYMRPYNQLTVEYGVEAVRRGQLDAFIYDALVLDYLASQDQECKLVNVGSWFSMTGYALAFPRNSRYYDKFNMKMLEYRKNGELDRLRRFWMQGLCKPGQTRHSKSKPLDLSQFMSAFLLLGAGILCSVFTLVLEHLYILYIRDKILKIRNRKRLLKYLYPFSLSLTDSLRLPSDYESGSNGSENKIRNLNDEARSKAICCKTTNIEMQILNDQQNRSHAKSRAESTSELFEVHL